MHGFHASDTECDAGVFLCLGSAASIAFVLLVVWVLSHLR
jgi:hypothetical protein